MEKRLELSRLPPIRVFEQHTHQVDVRQEQILRIEKKNHHEGDEEVEEGLTAEEDYSVHVVHLLIVGAELPRFVGVNLVDLHCYYRCYYYLLLWNQDLRAYQEWFCLWVNQQKEKEQLFVVAWDWDWNWVVVENEEGEEVFQKEKVAYPPVQHVH